MELIYSNGPGFPPQYRLSINVGINGGPARPYLFDTGSSLFNAAYTQAWWPGFTPTISPSTGNTPASTVANGSGVTYCYGNGIGGCRGYQGNIVQATTLDFYTPPISGESQTLAASLNAAPGYQINALYNQISGGVATLIAGTTTPIEEGIFYGVFGAGDFTTVPIGSGYTAGGVLGQTTVSNVTQGYVVAANGQVNPVNGVANPPQQTNGQNVVLGGTRQAVTGCSPCVTLGLTPQVLGQFAPVNPGSATNPRGLVPWSNLGPGTFANPYGGATGNNAAAEFGARFNVSLSPPGGGAAVSTTAAALLDTGTGGLTLSTLLENQPGISNGTSVLPGVILSATGVNADGSPIAGLTTSSSVLQAAGTDPITYTALFDQKTPGTTNTIGLSFFLQNSVLFDLDNQAIGYTPFFVTDANLSTTVGGPLIVDGTNLPLGLAGVISGPGGVTIGSGGAVQLSATNTYTGLTVIGAGGQLYVSGQGSIAPSTGVANYGLLDISRAWDPVSIQALSGAGQVNLGGQNLTITNASGDFTGIIADGGAYNAPGGSLTVAGGTQTLSGANTYTGLSTIAAGGELFIAGQGSVAASAGVVNDGVFDISRTANPIAVQNLTGTGQVKLGGQNLTIASGNGIFSGTIADGGASPGTGGSLALAGGILLLSGANTYTGGTTVTGGAILGVFADSNLGAASGGLTLAGGTLAAMASFSSARPMTLGTGGGTFNTNGFDVTLGTPVSGVGGLTKTGTGVLTLSGAANYAGGTTVNAGTLQLALGASLPTMGALIVNGGLFDFNGNNVTVGSLQGLGGTISLGSGTLTVAESTNTTLAAVITGTGGLTMSGPGTLNLTGVNTYTGPTTISNGRLAVNGSITSNVSVGSGGNLGGNGTITGVVTNNGIVAPGNSIGTLNVVGTFAQGAGSTYQVETNAVGQADRINVTGAPGTATITGGMVGVLAEAGVYAPSTTYTILNATGGVSGTYVSSSTNFPFLQSSLSYDSNNVYLTLAPGGFARGAATANQAAVGGVLDRSVAGSSGDFATVLGTLSTATLQQGQAAMDAISGQNYSGFATAGITGSLGFMNVLGQQMSLARGGPGTGTRTALAQACEVACEDEPPSPFSIWGSALGVTGSVAGNGSSSTLTYNGGGTAAGIDYRVNPSLLVGLGLGFTSGNQWLGGLSGRGTTDSYQGGLYASFTRSTFYLDALAGFGFSSNTMTRQIVIPGLQSRTALGQTTANQFVGQAEAGYAIGLHTPSMTSITPFARLQGVSNNQAGFSESGASSLNLTVAQQTTNSLRSTLGIDFAGAFDLGWRDRLALQVRLGWAHEYADTSRPVTAAFAGAPGAAFTVFGATPQRDAAVIGLAAGTAIAASTSLYLRYDGEIGTGTDNHALSAGIRMSW